MPLNSTTSFGITIEVSGSVIVVANLSASAALLLDVTTQIVVVLNGSLDDDLSKRIANLNNCRH